MWLSLLVAVTWSLSPFFTREGRDPFIRQEVLSPANTGLLLLSIFVVAGGILFWWGLDHLFWHKYFPTQTPPNPPERAVKKRKK